MTNVFIAAIIAAFVVFQGFKKLSNEDTLLKMASRWAIKEQWGWSSDTYLSDEEGLDLLKALLVCTKGDAVISEAEREWALGFAACREMPMSIIEAGRAYDANEDIADILSRSPIVQKGKKGVIYWAIKACSADAEYNDLEKAAIRKMAGLMGVSEQVVEEMEAVISEEQKLMDKRNALVYDSKVLWE
ncbi:MAG: hypothetical protein F6K23_16180 [Okeania sp. SIO2C9]|uniref:hypothetical protein n=1 Tax=Okeania sp. SIO2C9 TaxID=2607791 RepID=UPI0013C058C5|nr:hypothetical protein [Okeania sp. SIO2C9]NEQ74432.1 hypothetical protein [Okeania sp. SIO2C9]